MLHYIEDDGTALIVHECGEQPLFEMRQMQCRKLLAALKTVLIHTAFLIAEEGAGHAVHDHEPIAAFFQVSLVKIFAALAQVPGQVIGFRIVDQDHQALAAVAAIGAVDEGTDLLVQAGDQLVYLPVVPLFHKILEPVILSCMGSRKSRNFFQVGLDMVGFCFDAAKLSCMDRRKRVNSGFWAIYPHSGPICRKVKLCRGGRWLDLRVGGELAN